MVPGLNSCPMICAAYFIGVSKGKRAKRTCPPIFVVDLTGGLAELFYYRNCRDLKDI
jgi:hypothetical protein